MAHDYEVLERIMPCLQGGNRGEWKDESRSLLRKALEVNAAERKLRHGPRSVKWGQKTIKLLLSFAFRREPLPPDEAYLCLSTTIFVGSMDLFLVLLSKMQNIKEPLSLELPGYFPLLHLSIIDNRREMFSALLKCGIDINKRSVTWSGLRPLHVAAAAHVTLFTLKSYSPKGLIFLPPTIKEGHRPTF